MRVIVLFLVFLGIGFLGYFYFFGDIIEVDSLEDLETLIDGQKIYVEGLVYREGSWGERQRLFLSNGVELICNCFGYSGLEVKVEGRVEEFQGKRVIVKKIDIK